jgi:subtilisin family serine protease
MGKLLLTALVIILLTPLTAPAEVSVDGRLNWLGSLERSENFSGSFRFHEKPSDSQLDLLMEMGVEFFDHGHGPIGSRTIFPARIPFGAMADLKQLDFLMTIECSWRPRSKPPLAQSRPQVEADQAWEVASPLGGTLSGAGVIICDIDTGANYLHATTFQLSDDVYNWLDTDLSGDLSPGDGVDLNGNGSLDGGENLLFKEASSTSQYGNVVGQYDSNFDFLYNDANGNGARDYGPPAFGENDPCYGERFFMLDDLDGDHRLDPGEQLLGLGQSKIRAIYNKNDQVYRRGIDLLQSEMDTWGHGAPVTGIFGGGWPGLNAMSGMAPGIESLHVDYDFVYEPPYLLPIEAGLAWAVNEGADIVLIEDGEWVWEYLDGSSNIEIMINEYAADDDVIFIIPAGNLATGNMHSSFQSGGGEVLQVSSSRRIVWPSFLWTEPVTLTCTLTPPGGTPIVLPADGTTLLEQDYTIYSNLSISTRGTRRLDIRLADAAGSTIGGNWTFSFTGPDTPLHGYFGDDQYGWFSSCYWVGGLDQAYTVTWPATADSAISVAAYSVTGDGDIDYYSGWGPRIDGRPDVDIAAPGATVYTASPWNDTGFTSFNGTSGAGPHVAGAAALLRELLPTLDNGLCRYYLRLGAGTDGWTDDPHRWGSGKLRIHSAISHMITDVAETVPFPELRLSASPNPFNPRTTIRFDLPTGHEASLRVFSVDGREVWSRELTAGSPGPREVVWNGVNRQGQTQASGVYFAHVIQGERYAATKLTLLK